MGLFDYGLLGMGVNYAKHGQLFGKPEKETTGIPKGFERYETFDPQQKMLFQNLLSQLGGGGQAQGPGGQALSYWQNLLSGSPESTAAFEAPYLRQFNEQTIPGLAERFSGAGAGAQSSSAFQNALGQAGAGLQENLASLRSGLQSQAAPRIMELLKNLLGQSSFGLVQKEQPFWKSLLSSGAQGLGQAAGTAALGFL